MTTYSWEDDLTPVFEGKSIIGANVDDETLTLSDGTVVRVEGNSGCWGCVGGNYALEEVATVENIITATSVEVEDNGHTYYRIFVFCGDEKINVATFAGHDGSGYYGTGFHLTVAEA